jgi:hypothetical protein
METVSTCLGDYLKSGWTVVGYSIAPGGAGGVLHVILVQRAASLVSITIGRNGSRETVRSATLLAGRSHEPAGLESPPGSWERPLLAQSEPQIDPATGTPPTTAKNATNPVIASRWPKLSL